ncbi:MAG TPA: carbohydrate ABC transporter permease [Devosia sp.]|nr:carbohydrate ABC transporter permease [Devosia sp.]
MRLPKINVGRVAAHAALLFFVVVWTFPTVGLLISSVRDKDQLALTGWWTALAHSTLMAASRAPTADKAVQEGDHWVTRGNLFGKATNQTIETYGETNATIGKTLAGQPLDMQDGGQLVVQANGDYVWTFPQQPTYKGAPRIYYVTGSPPRFTLENYQRVLGSTGVAASFINSLTVAIPSTVIPIMIAAFAAYALAWMQFPFRGFIVAVVVGLLVVPLQMSLIPLLRLYNIIAGSFGVESKGYLGVWLAHTAFGLPLAIYLLRNYMAGLPREIMESARMDGASHFKTFTTMVLPLSFPALASFAIFQFLWIWNDLLVALVFLGAQEDRMVLTARLVNLLGQYGNNWELLTSAAFISIVVPLIVFFSLQRYFVRGLLAGSVK